MWAYGHNGCHRRRGQWGELLKEERIVIVNPGRQCIQSTTIQGAKSLHEVAGEFSSEFRYLRIVEMDLDKNG